MSLELIPYSDYDNPYELATQMHEAVVDSKEILKKRNILGPIARYGGEAITSIENIKKGQREHTKGILGHFAIVGDSGDVVGAASIFPELELRKVRLPIPAGLAMGRLAVEYPYAALNIQAWLKEDEDGLTGIYSNLIDLSSSLNYHQRIAGTSMEKPWHNGSAWTVESASSPKEIHDAIKKTRLHKLTTKRFDEGEGKRMIPPRSTLYAEIKSVWLSKKGELKELRTGDQSFLSELEFEMLSRNPRG